MSFVDGTANDVTVTSIDVAIIPVNGYPAEVVFAFGLGDNVGRGTDLSATFPPQADAKPEIGYQRSLEGLETDPRLRADLVALADGACRPAGAARPVARASRGPVWSSQRYGLSTGLGGEDPPCP